MLKTRLATAAVGIPLVAAVIWTGGWWLTGVVAATAAIAVLEIAAARGALWRPVSLLGATLAFALPVAAKLGGAWPDRTVTAVALLPAALLCLARDPARDVDDWLWTVAMVAYVGWLSSRFVLLRGLEDGRWWLFLVVLTVWITDTGAYFVGRLIGRHKMAPGVSPGKTWEGAVAGEVWGFAAVLGLKEAFSLDLVLAHAAVLGLLLPAVAQVGDLAESAIKRGLGVKDSSGLVPGHGGITDRLDSLLFAIPVLYYDLVWFVL
jgi:phosphatidate cytidylyltransferase